MVCVRPSVFQSPSSSSIAGYAQTPSVSTEKKVLAKQQQRDKSTATIAIKKRTAAIDSRRRIDPGARVPAPARPQEEGAHRNPHNGVGSRKGLAENATDATRRPTSKRRRGLRGLPDRSDDRIQSEREE